jgi:hypothetical protein
MSTAELQARTERLDELQANTAKELYRVRAGLVGSELSADERAAYLAALGDAGDGLRSAWVVLPLRRESRVSPMLRGVYTFISEGFVVFALPEIA